MATARTASATTIIDTDSTGKLDSEESDAFGRAHARDSAAKIANTAKLEKTSIRDFITLSLGV